jgi:hypothetical protein
VIGASASPVTQTVRDAEKTADGAEFRGLDCATEIEPLMDANRR